MHWQQMHEWEAGDGASEDEIVAEEQGVSSYPQHSRRALIGASVAAVLVSALLLAATSLQPAPPLVPRSEPEMLVSLKKAVQPWTTKHGTGCKNWHGIYIAKGVYDTVSACGDVCKRLPGCLSFNFQPQLCVNVTPNTGTVQNTCYLQSEECEETENSCWDLHLMKSPLPPTWQLVASRTGCGNWKDVEIARQVTDSAAECALVCQSYKDKCKYFNFHQRTLCEDDQYLWGEPGTCVIFGGECKLIKNSCWDLYRLSR